MGKIDLKAAPSNFDKEDESSSDDLSD